MMLIVVDLRDSEQEHMSKTAAGRYFIAASLKELLIVTILYIILDATH